MTDFVRTGVGHRTVLLVLCPKLRLPGCPYCGRHRKPTAETCTYCDDLPELDDD